MSGLIGRDDGQGNCAAIVVIVPEWSGMQEQDVARWKEELGQFARQIRDQIKTVPEGDSAYFELERPLLYSAFLVRKLIENRTVTDNTKSRWVEVQEHPSLRDGQPLFLELVFVDINEPDRGLRIEDHFDLETSNVVRISYLDLASEIVHSEHLAWVPVEKHLGAFVVFSYRNMLKRALMVAIPCYLEMLEAIIADRATRWYRSLNLETGKYSDHVE